MGSGRSSGIAMTEHTHLGLTHLGLTPRDRFMRAIRSAASEIFDVP